MLVYQRVNQIGSFPQVGGENKQIFETKFCHAVIYTPWICLLKMFGKIENMTQLLVFHGDLLQVWQNPP